MALVIAGMGLPSNILPAFSQCNLSSSKLFNAVNRGHWHVMTSVVNQHEPRGEISFSEQEKSLIEALVGVPSRGGLASLRQLQDINQAVKNLEDLQGVPNPTNSELIEGCWQLMFSTRPRTASSVQKTFVGVDFFPIFQEVCLQTSDSRVINIVNLSNAIGELRIEAQASSEDSKRINFEFDKATLSVKFLPFELPYILPFALLGEGAKGWLDTTYLSPSGNLRISRGNKGTTFVLQKKMEPRQRLLTAISTGTRVEKAISEVISLNEEVVRGESELIEGQWRLIWSSQTETDSWFENASRGLMGTQIVKENGKLQFLVDILFGIRFSIFGTCVRLGGNAFDVRMDDAAILVGKYGVPLEFQSKFTVEILYMDDKIRISKGYSNIISVHLRIS